MANFLNILKNSLSHSLPKRITDGEFFVFLHQYDLELSYQLKVSSRRKRLALELQRGKVTVRAPYWLSLEDIESFILSKQDWLMDKLQNQSTLPPVCQFNDGDKLLVFGDWITLRIVPSRQFFLHLDSDNAELQFYLPSRVKDQRKYIKSKLKAFYLELAQQDIPKRLEQLQEQTALKSTSLELKIFKSRWGCCYRSGLIKINPMLMGAPSWVRDCVIVHELCHLKHMDHSKAFWQLNQQYCDNCAATKEWLKTHGGNLHLD